jgi:hypothetical protein
LVWPGVKVWNIFRVLGLFLLFWGRWVVWFMRGGFLRERFRGKFGKVLLELLVEFGDEEVV